MTTRRRVIADHRASYPDALVIAVGEVLNVVDRETAWSGWIWCVDGAGKGAWVPGEFLDRRGDTCVALRDYDSTELDVSMGDIVEAGEATSGWVWCVDSRGNRGWVPARSLAPVDDVPA
ncbi:MAG: hypothetical protein C4536_12630 [Actinobacteria bacterium]|jgi:hypothetical protein|nr:MAG: hypothetical protein C4536_12630 [Actinomycetota bacterium]